MKPNAATNRSSRVERTRQALLDALLELITEKGYERVTVKNVLRRADVGRTAFYTHFENKEDLLPHRIEAIPWIVQGKDSSSPFDVSFLFVHIADQRDLIAGLKGTPAFDESLERLQRSVLASFTHLLQELSVNRDIDSNQHLTAHALTGALMQLLIWWLEAGMPETPTTMASWFNQLANRMV